MMVGGDAYNTSEATVIFFVGSPVLNNGESADDTLLS